MNTDISTFGNMQSRRYALEGKGHLFSEEEMGLPIDELARNGTVLLGWDVGSICSSDNNLLTSDREAVERMEFMNLGFNDLMRKPFLNNRFMEHLGGDISSGVFESVSSPTCMITSNAIFVEEQSGSMVSNSFMESNSPESSFIDLKLGGLPDCIDANNGKVSDERSVLSPVSSSLPAKRARMTNFNTQTPFCQVHGCNKDLNSSKDYHKRHKVCDVHTKTAKVIVNGIEKRFCQQCSRFHLLSEFDDGKRSCRKRLACHNERRRKTHFDTNSGKPQKLLHSYQAARFQGYSFSARKPFVLSDKSPSRVLYSDRSEVVSCKHAKLDHEPIYRHEVLTSTANGHLLPKPNLPMHGVGKQYLSGIPSSGTEDYSLFNTPATTVHEMFGVSNSGCALSLLSAQSQDFSSHLAGFPMASPMIMQGSHSRYTMGPKVDKSLGVSSLENFTFCGFHSSGMNLVENEQMEPKILTDAGNSADFEVHEDGIFQGSNRLNTKYCRSPEPEVTVDLLQLSSHLQRVEQKRNFDQVKTENELCYFPTL